MYIKKGQEITVTITDAAFEGKGIGRLGEQVVFIKNTAPGDKVTARVTRRKKKFLEARLLNVLQSGEVRTEPVCSHAGICGGCTWQHVLYEEQLRFKRQHVQDHMVRIGGLMDIDVSLVLGSDEKLYYRNKMEYTFGDRRWLTDEEIASGDPIPDKDLAAGMHIPGRFDRILNLNECHLQIPVSWQIMDFVRDYATRLDIPPYNAIRHEGFIRNVMIRNSAVSGDLLVNIVTYEDDQEIMTSLTSALLERFQEITSVVNNVNDTWSPSSEGRYENILFGQGYITESIGGYNFKISSNTFFQTNTKQAEKLYQVALDYAGLTGNELVYDLYCGVGSLTLFVSGHCDTAIGIEINPESIRKAEENASENEVTNCRFETGDMKDAFTSTLFDKYGKPDVIITDPPRAGMHPGVIATMLQTEAERIVYVSCNSATQARDLALLQEKYHIDAIQPVDMFPQTYHIESVAKLTLKKSR
ncbi:MAG: 23S rRNA (uracil(1939)-C(5))-methyltransferase RlmD [Cyclonatronaceae bacterium]